MIFVVLLSIKLCFCQVGGGGCYWAVGKSGNNLECLPDFYIHGGCESGSRDDCTFDGLVGGDAFGIQCCPSDRQMNFEGATNCIWYHGLSGRLVACPEGQVAFGRCSTSQRSSDGGDCAEDASHSVKCCEAASTVRESSCGWIYVKYGVKQKCPSGYLVAGFCGVNNKDDCPNDSFLCLRCCTAS